MGVAQSSASSCMRSASREQAHMLIGLGARGANTTSAWETGGLPRFKSPVTRTQRAPLRRGHRHHALADSNALHARPACLHHSQACKGKGSGATSGCTLQSAGWRHLLVMGTLTFLWLALMEMWQHWSHWQPHPKGDAAANCRRPSVHACSRRGRTSHKATARQTGVECTRPSAPGVSGSFGRPMRP